MRALHFAKSLQTVLLVEPQAAGGWLGECPGCQAPPNAGLSLAFNQVGEDIVVHCHGGCSEIDLINGLYIPGDGVEVITAQRWIDREAERGHDKEYLQEKLSQVLPLPEALRPLPVPPIAKALTFEELLALEVEPRAELCGSWLKESTVTEVYGWRGAGKSWFGLSLAYCVAAGVDFMRWGVPENRGVLYVDGEMDLEDIQDRLSKIHKGETKRAGRALHPNLHYLADSNLTAFPDGLPKLSTPEGRALVEANLEGRSLLILDNLSTLYNSAIENDAESWVEAQDWMISLRRRGVAVVFVHHAGKGGQQRGTSKREDVCNNVIALKQPEDHQAEDGCAFTLKFEKSRGVKGPAVASFSARLLTDEDGDLVWGLEDTKEERAVVARSMKTEGATTREIAKALGVGVATVQRDLDKTSTKSKGACSAVPPPRRGGAEHSNNPEPRGGTERGTRAEQAEQVQQNPHYQRVISLVERNTERNKGGTEGLVPCSVPPLISVPPEQ